MRVPPTIAQPAAAAATRQVRASCTHLGAPSVPQGSGAQLALF
jgi:hypothetical protein